MSDALDGQRRHWDLTFAANPGMFGEEPSAAARAAVELFRREGTTELLELGGGHGRDTLFFAREGFRVHVLDYAATGVRAIREKARASGLGAAITALQHDVRTPLPFPEAAFTACYSHMLFCMALTAAELAALSAEVRRALRPGGIHVYTVRHTGDPHYGAGIHRGEDLYEVGGFIVHFFSRATVERLATGFELVGVDEFVEGTLPRRLFRVTLRKPAANPA